MSLVFVMTYCTGKISLSGEIWVRGVLGHGTGFCLEEQRSCQVSTLGGVRTWLPAWHWGSTTNPGPGCVGMHTGEPDVGKNEGKDSGGKAGVFALSRLKLQFLRSHPAGTARRWPEPTRSNGRGSSANLPWLRHRGSNSWVVFQHSYCHLNCSFIPKANSKVLCP